MAIDFNSVDNGAAPAAEVTPTPGVSLNLEKGAVLDLSKAAPGLENAMLGAGWDVAENGASFDLDISAFLLNSSNKVQSAEDVIFYNHMQGKGITLNGDNRTGAGDGDDETIDISLSSLPSHVDKVVFCVTIDKAAEKNQTFGMVNNSYVRLVNKQDGSEIARYSLKESYSDATAVIFAELFKANGVWEFKAVGDGKTADLNGLLAMWS